MTYETWVLINLVVLVFAAIVSTGLVALYLCLPWYKTAYGRALMFSSVALAITIDGGLVMTVFHIAPPLSTGIETVFYILLALAITAKFLVVLKEYRKDYKAARKDRHASK